MTERSLQDVERETLDGIRASVDDPILMDLGCGYADLPDGFLGVDYYSRGESILNADLFSAPWPFASDSVDAFTSSHFVEHVTDWNLHFTEVYRCLKPGGIYRFIGPYAKSDRFLQDPTHKQALTEARLAYLQQPWLRAQKLAHCHPRINFSVVALGYAWNADVEDYMLGASEQARAYKLSHEWNIADDIFVILRKEEMPDGD